MSRILVVDYGLSNIGIALGIGLLVEPYKIIPNTPNRKLESDALLQIAEIVEMEHIDVVVVGIPHRNGEEVGYSRIIRKFAGNLRGKIDANVKIEFVDETSTSKESVDVALDAGISQKRRKADHSIAAGLIIKRWWEENSVKTA